MRVYFEKPRTTVGLEGADQTIRNLDHSYDITPGLPLPVPAAALASWGLRRPRNFLNPVCPNHRRF